MRPQLRLALLLIPVTVLTGCQTDTVSLEEAKQISTKFQGSSFTPPPRSISDITGFLDKYTATGSDAFRRLQKPRTVNRRPVSMASRLGTSIFRAPNPPDCWGGTSKASPTL